jgi:hypothetical protein
MSVVCRTVRVGYTSHHATPHHTKGVCPSSWKPFIFVIDATVRNIPTNHHKMMSEFSLTGASFIISANPLAHSVATRLVYEESSALTHLPYMSVAFIIPLILTS